MLDLCVNDFSTSLGRMKTKRQNKNTSTVWCSGHGKIIHCTRRPSPFATRKRTRVVRIGHVRSPNSWGRPRNDFTENLGENVRRNERVHNLPRDTLSIPLRGNSPRRQSRNTVRRRTDDTTTRRLSAQLITAVTSIT